MANTTPTEKYVLNDDELSIEITNVNWLAQTFTIGTVGINVDFELTSIEIKGQYTGSDQTVTVEVYETTPAAEPSSQSTSDAISTGSIASSQFSSGASGSWRKVDMSSVTLKRDGVYALVIRGTSSGGFKWRADGTSPTYTGGSTWASVDTGQNWTEDDTTDYMFQINGADGTTTLCTVSEATNKAGGSATGNAVNALLVVPWINQIESYINVETEYNWIDNYATLNDDVKNILNRTCSAGAAINIITYGLVADDNRVASETMVNIYREELSGGINSLRDRAKKNFISSESP